jgi:hypothetical protein
VTSPPLDRLVEEAVNIAWVYLQQTGELGNDAARYLDAGASVTGCF